MNSFKDKLNKQIKEHYEKNESGVVIVSSMKDSKSQNMLNFEFQKDNNSINQIVDKVYNSLEKKTDYPFTFSLQFLFNGENPFGLTFIGLKKEKDYFPFELFITHNYKIYYQNVT